MKPRDAAPLPIEDLDHVLEHTRGLWGELGGGRIFITGGTGFFGCWLIETFRHANRQLELGAQAVVLSRNPAAFSARMPHLAGADDLHFVAGDIRSFGFPAGEFTHVIHACATSRAPVPPLEMFDTIVSGTRRALEFAVAANAKKFLFVSSGAVYGKQPPEIERVPEDYRGAPDPCDPGSAYGEGKRAAEMLCAIFSGTRGLDAKIARCFAFVGPHLPLDAHFAVGNFIRDAMAGGPIAVKDGAPCRSYLYAADLAIWLWTILFKGAACRPYNVGGAEITTIDALAEMIAVDHGVEVSRLGAAASPAPARYVPDTGRASREFGLCAWTGLRSALERTIRWHGGE